VQKDQLVQLLKFVSKLTSFMRTPVIAAKANCYSKRTFLTQHFPPASF